MTASAQNPIVIVGASLAGMNAAQVLRRGGYGGELIVIGDELDQPYDRPPLSKEFLTTEIDLDRLTLPPARKAEELELDLRLGVRALGVDLERSVVQVAARTGDTPTAMNEDVPFAGLIVATGARARALPPDLIDGGPEATANPMAQSATESVNGLVTLRSLDDARRLKSALDANTGPVVVCGAGFIGGEVAASARTLGHDVILLEAAEAPLTRVLDADSGMAVAELHRGHGVDVRLSTSLTVVHLDRGRVCAVTLSDGSRIDTGLVVVGIGAIPNTAWLAESGLTVDNGVVVDQYCRAAKNVVAAGDVARFPNRRFGGTLMRIEQWDNAVEMARFAANSLLADLGITASGDEDLAPFAPVPWFWSDQYDRKIQLAGVRSDEAVMAQGSLAEQQFVRLYHDAEGLCGVLTWNRPRQAIIGRQLIDQRVSLIDALAKLGA